MDGGPQQFLSQFSNCRKILEMQHGVCLPLFAIITSISPYTEEFAWQQKTACVAHFVAD